MRIKTSKILFEYRLPLRFVSPNHIYELCAVDIGGGSCVKVIGDPDNGAYEWCICDSRGTLQYSDWGYGISDIALAHGLLAAYGHDLATKFEREVAEIVAGSHTKTYQQLQAYRIGLEEVNEYRAGMRKHLVKRWGIDRPGCYVPPGMTLVQQETYNIIEALDARDDQEYWRVY